MSDTIKYEFTLSDQSHFTFDINLNREPNALIGDSYADWTLLEFNQCKNCTFSSDKVRRCPVAVDVYNVVDRFQKILSYEKADVKIIDNQRTYIKNCAAQDGLKSLLGLIMSTSGCPILGPMQNMAHFHLPFASFEETLYRTVGNYYIRLYFQKKSDPELKGLMKIYENLSELNTSFLNRIRAASEKDANLNAILNLFALSSLVTDSIENGLQELHPFFTDVLE